MSRCHLAPDVVCGIDGIDHAAIALQFCQINGQPIDGIFQDVEHCNRHIGSFAFLRFDFNVEIAVLDGIQDTNIERQLAETDKRIAELAATGLSSSEDSSDFLKKASYFIMVNKLIEDASVDYEKLVRTLDPTAIRDFVLNIVQEVEATDGRITAITFRNGTAHRFKYKT